ncbi:MAG: hypothetical protein V3U20_06480, partial [Thermoplasmata archaeon]
MRKVLAVTMTLFFVMGLIPTVCATSDSMKVLLFLEGPDDDYSNEVGDNVAVEVRVFDKGQPKDADTSPTVTLSQYGSNERKITVEKVGTGIYSGSFTIMESDGDYIMVSTEATLGKENEIDFSYDEDADYDLVWIVGEENLEVEFEFDDNPSSDIVAFPGDTLDMTITVENNGIKVKPDSFSLTTSEEEIEYTNPRIGVFKASYTVSLTITESTSIYIRAEAEYNDDQDSDGGDIVVSFYSVWYHRVSITDSHAQFELCVADIYGMAVEGAEIDFEYETDDEEGSRSGTTDSEGKSFFTISHDSSSSIWIEGTVVYSGKAQNFYGHIYLSDEEPGSDIEEPSPYADFQVIYQENAGEIGLGETVTLEYIAYEETIPLPDQPIYYYIHTDEEFISSGSRTTDSNAKFTITFMTPEDIGSVEVEFESPFEKEYSGEHGDTDDELVYRGDNDYMFISSGSPSESFFGDPDESIVIETSPLKIGGKTTVTASMLDSEGYYAFAWVLVGEYTLEDVVSDTGLEWEPWASIFPISYNLVTVEDDKFTQDVILPEFLPNDETYTMMVFFLDPDDPGFPYHWNYVHVRPGENVGSEDEQNFFLQSPINIGGIGIPWLAIVIIIALILVALVVGIRRRGSEAQTTRTYQYPNSYVETPSRQVYEQPYQPEYPDRPVYQRDYTRVDRPSPSPQIIFPEVFEEPYQQRYSKQLRVYQRDYAQADRSPPLPPPPQPSAVKS